MRKKRSKIQCECKCLKDPKYNSIIPKVDGNEIKVSVQRLQKTKWREVKSFENVCDSNAVEELVRLVEDWSKYWGKK